MESLTVKRRDGFITVFYLDTAGERQMRLGSRSIAYRPFPQVSNAAARFFQGGRVLPTRLSGEEPADHAMFCSHYSTVTDFARFLACPRLFPFCKGGMIGQHL